MVGFVGCGQCRLQLSPLNAIQGVTTLAKVEVEAVITLVSHVLDGVFAATVAFNLALGRLTGLNGNFDAMLWRVAAYFE